MAVVMSGVDRSKTFTVSVHKFIVIAILYSLYTHAEQFQCLIKPYGSTVAASTYDGGLSYLLNVLQWPRPTTSPSCKTPPTVAASESLET